MKRTAVIMAGGSGERFWPLSRRKKPKQLLNLSSPDKMMIEESIDRIAPLIKPEDIYIITSELLQEPVKNVLTLLPAENIIAEPAKRNTAPCLALSASFIAEKYLTMGYAAKDISIAILTADQCISPDEGFIKTVETAMEYVENNNAIATIGIPPSRPETGYGYIEIEDKYNLQNHIAEVKSVLQFREKPDAATAAKYIESGRFFWNSGMFFWRLDTFCEAMKENIPEVGNKIAEMSTSYKDMTGKYIQGANESIRIMYENFPNISIDYGLMERAKDVVVVNALFRWDDIGAWDSLDRIREKNEIGNIISGKTSVVDSSNSIIINESKGGKIIAALGIDNLVVVMTDDAVLICPKDRAQEVKKNVENIRDKYGEDLL